MFKLILSSLFFVIFSPHVDATSSLSRTPEDIEYVNKLSKNVKLEKGSLIVLNQEMKDKINPNNTFYRLIYLCEHKKRDDSCSLYKVEYEPIEAAQ